MIRWGPVPFVQNRRHMSNPSTVTCTCARSVAALLRTDQNIPQRGLQDNHGSRRGLQDKAGRVRFTLRSAAREAPLRSIRR